MRVSIGCCSVKYSKKREIGVQKLKCRVMGYSSHGAATEEAADVGEPNGPII